MPESTNADRSANQGYAIYTIVPNSHQSLGFAVEVLGVNGVRQTLLGFPTEADAEEWIASDRVRDAAAITPN